MAAKHSASHQALPAVADTIEKQTVILKAPLSIYSLKTSARVGTVAVEESISVIDLEAAGMVRIRFSREGKWFEAKCRRADLGI